MQKSDNDIVRWKWRASRAGEDCGERVYCHEWEEGVQKSCISALALLCAAPVLIWDYFRVYFAVKQSRPGKFNCCDRESFDAYAKPGTLLVNVILFIGYLAFITQPLLSVIFTFIVMWGEVGVFMWMKLILATLGVVSGLVVGLVWIIVFLRQLENSFPPVAKYLGVKNVHATVYETEPVIPTMMEP